MQGPLRAPARPLGPRLRRVRPAVVLEVELADHLGPVGLVGQLGEELLRIADRRARDVLQVLDARERLEHLRRRPAAAVAPPEDEQAARRQRVVLEVARRAAQLGHGRLGVVGVGRREVGEHRRAVDPDPAEGVVLGRVEAVPRELLREEAVDPGAAHDLRQLAVVAEHVGVPEHAARGDRARARRSAGRRRTGARATRPAGRLQSGSIHVPPTGSHCPAATRSRIRAHRPGRAIADPRVLLGLRAGEPVRRVALHEPQLGRERPHALAERLLQRPQPRRVDVRVADGGDLVRPRRVAPLPSSGARIARAAGQVARSLRIPRVAEAVELAQELAAPRVVDARLVHQRRQHVEVARQRPRLAVEARELAALEAEGRRRRRRRAGAAGWSSDHPNSPLQAISTRALSALPRRRALGEHRVGPDVRAPLTSPWTGSPSSHSVASELVTSSRSTCSPSHSGGTRPSTASHHVAHSGPERHPRRRVAVLERGRLRQARCGRRAPRSARGRAPARRRARATARDARPGARARACSPGVRASPPRPSIARDCTRAATRAHTAGRAPATAEKR